MASLQKSSSKNKYGFKQRTTRIPQAQTFTRPTGIQKKSKKKEPEASTDTDHKRKAQGLGKYGLEGREICPVVLGPDFAIRVEEDPVKIKAEEERTFDFPISINAAPLNTDCIHGLKEPGKLREYANMTREKREAHDYQCFDDTIERDREAARKCKAMLKSARENGKTQQCKGSQNNDLDNETWIDDGDRVVEQINDLYSYRGVYFSDAQALYALQDLERRGEIRIHDDKVFFPDAFHLIPVDAERTEKRETRIPSTKRPLPSMSSQAEIVNVQQSVSSLASFHAPLSTERFNEFRKTLSKLVNNPESMKDKLVSAEQVWQGLNSVLAGPLKKNIPVENDVAGSSSIPPPATKVSLHIAVSGPILPGFNPSQTLTMALPLSIFLGGCVVAIPVVTGVAQGVEHQKKQNEEAANESRMWKFNCLVSCVDPDPIAQEEVDHGILVVRHDKVWVVPRDEDNRPQWPEGYDGEGKEPMHPFAGFYIAYPDEDRSPPERGLVTTISDDPPMLNWVYCDKETYELRYSNRTGSIAHHVGVWDWTEDETHLTFEGWEGFVAVDEWDGADEDPSTRWGKEGLRWAVYYDKDDNGLRGKHKGRDMFEISLKRRIQSAEEQLKQNEAAEKKMQVKSRGGLSTSFAAPQKERDKEWEKKFGEKARLELEKKLAKDREEGQGPEWERGEVGKVDE
ncbi:hypothetical protein HRS9122_03170 [Pyrenophora teres f. teres]|nr:hypothetical protein HRS9122_03170 [Pyrenophora teres f. teres]